MKKLAAVALVAVVMLTAGCVELFSLCLLPCAVCLDVSNGGDGRFGVSPSAASQANAVTEHVVNAAPGDLKY